MTALGRGFGTQIRHRGIEPRIVVGKDYRDYSLAIKNALVTGLMQAGIKVKDIGGTLAGRPIDRIVIVNGARTILDNDVWGFVRALSNTPNLVIGVEITESGIEFRAFFADLDTFARRKPSVGDNDQSL